MKCEKCDRKSVYLNPSLCREDFCSYIEDKVFSTIEKYRLIKSAEKVVVAASGGKDSLTLLNILSKRYKVNCLAIDEGIEEYREKTLNALKIFCEEKDIKLQIVTYKEEFGANLSGFLGAEKPCSVCGTLRRYLLNKFARNYDKICTGHNLDDEAQSIIMNLLKPNVELLMRIGPITGTDSFNGFVQRIKPLYFIKEKEIVTYAYLNQLPIGYDECPHAINSFRAKIRDLLNDYEAKHPGTKENIINFFLELKPRLRKFRTITELNYCKKCSEPSKSDICNTCKLIYSFQQKIKCV